MNQLHAVRFFLLLDTIATLLPLTSFVDTVVSYGGTPLMAHLFTSVRSLFTAVTYPLFGNLSDSVGRKPVLIIATLGLVIDSLLEILVPRLTTVFIGRFIVGVTRVTGSTVNTVTCDRTSPGIARMSALTQNSIVFAIGFNVAVLSGGFLYLFSSKLINVIILLLSVLNFFLATLLIEETKPKGSSTTSQRTSGRFVLLKSLWKSDFQMFILIHLTLVLFSNMFLLCFIEYSREILKMKPSERSLLYFTIGISLIVSKVVLQPYNFCSFLCRLLSRSTFLKFLI